MRGVVGDYRSAEIEASYDVVLGESGLDSSAGSERGAAKAAGEGRVWVPRDRRASVLSRFARGGCRIHNESLQPAGAAVRSLSAGGIDERPALSLCFTQPHRKHTLLANWRYPASTSSSRLALRPNRCRASLTRVHHGLPGKRSPRTISIPALSLFSRRVLRSEKV